MEHSFLLMRMKDMHDNYKKQVEAYIDGELDDDQSKRVQETIHCFPVLQAYFRQLQCQKKLLNDWWASQRHH